MKIRMYWRQRHCIQSWYVHTWNLLHRVRRNALPLCNCSIQTAGYLILDQTAYHCEHQCVWEFKCFAKLIVWNITHHPNSHVRVPAARAWHDLFYKFYGNGYSTPATYTAVGARARTVQSPCGHNGWQIIPGCANFAFDNARRLTVHHCGHRHYINNCHGTKCEFRFIMWPAHNKD